MTAQTTPAEGWQGEKSWATPRAKYHYIRGAEALCGGLIFYGGELVDGGLTHSESKEDCAACKRKVDAELAALAERSPQPCPECAAGKHSSCAGFAFDEDDNETGCPCAPEHTNGSAP